MGFRINGIFKSVQVICYHELSSILLFTTNFDYANGPFRSSCEKYGKLQIQAKIRIHDRKKSQTMALNVV